MARMTREESQALTRTKLVSVARTLFTRDGYAATSLDRIAEEAGFSKGAVYSNFDGKESLFLEVLDEHGKQSLAAILAALAGAGTIDEAIDAIAHWAEKSSRKGNWPSLILDYSRNAKPAATFRKSQEKVLRAQWGALGERLLALAGNTDLAAETVGALVFELTYAPAMSFVSKPTSGDLLRVALHGVFRAPVDTRR
ncbi:TetR/AcrR family transcriptional regulator [Paraburkholderia acidisoli]|uniref:TetR family transcriptional regulator n=1 Tax=Paraburkholderia acidisoli TaxID=2571748 RepID=A0A7Z2GPT5_9BURK|nr:TetR/AcrR family transcriptional regulator [Paraburkholderia acidisoli]QGZ65344.1 TetR family transcriptional regulator [Paraburkholderia acidisoli]